MKLNVKLFARAKEIAGTDSVELNLPEAAQVADIRVALADRFPEMKPLIPSLLISVGTDYATEETPLTNETDIACFPPVSGG